MILFDSYYKFSALNNLKQDISRVEHLLNRINNFQIDFLDEEEANDLMDCPKEIEEGLKMMKDTLESMKRRKLYESDYNTIREHKLIVDKLINDFEEFLQKK